MKNVAEVLVVAVLLLVVLSCALLCPPEGRVAGKEDLHARRPRHADGEPGAGRHEDGPAAPKLKEVRGRELQEGNGTADSACPPLNSLELTFCRTLLTHLPDPPFRWDPFSPDRCFVVIRNIVYGLDGKHFYYLVVQRCRDSDGRRTKYSVSCMEGDLTSAGQGVGAGGVGSLATPRVVSHWWRAQSPSGLPPQSAEVFVPGSSMPFMAELSGTEMSKMGTHLLLTASSRGPSDPSWIVALNISDGSRSSIPMMAAEVAAGLTFDPAKTTLYVSDQYGPAEILEAPVIDPDVPGSLSMTTAVALGPLSGANVSQPEVGPYGFSADGSCLYFFDNDYERLWMFKRWTETVALLAVGVNDTAVPLRSDVLRVPMQGGPSALAVTADGMNVLFTTYFGELFHLTMSSPCGPPLKVVELTEHPTESFSALAMNESEGKLIVGTSGGHVLEFTVDLPPSPTPSPLSVHSATSIPPMSRSSQIAPPSFSHPSNPAPHSTLPRSAPPPFSNRPSPSTPPSIPRSPPPASSNPPTPLTPPLPHGLP
ncbi:hypothetical protein CBR_g54153 [Chara braunii]|uniref:Uncharacterized protein n=1 Tax=Chara braunii TaxID=69332 RepID=A0A388MC00_CHABU|nr:hypothetical protein CBR_g54153 [Chara braunii]|eukprot:GBG92033.1 hypothetical protein CBR_g54153 [Chara braunii]